MNFQQYDLGYQHTGSIVEVKLSGNAANIQLLDNMNFQNYKAGRAWKGHGGHYKKSPVRLAIPNSGTWHVTVDLGGYTGQVRSAVRMVS